MTETAIVELETVPERASGGFTEDFIKGNVRFDPITNMFSVIDAIKLACGVDTKIATQYLYRILKEDEGLEEKMIPHRFPKQRGKNDTPIATFVTVCEVISSINTKKAKEFRRTAMQVFARALGGDLQLAREIERTNARIAGTPLQDALLEGTGALSAGPGAGVPATGFGAGTVVQVLTREDSSRVAAARIASLRETADAEIQARRVAELEKVALLAKDVAGPGVPAHYAKETMKRASLSLAKIDMLTRAAIDDKSRPAAAASKRKRPDESSERDESFPMPATPGQMLAWTRSDDDQWVFPSEALAKEYERLVSYPCELTMSGAAIYCGGRAIPDEDDD